MNSRLLDKTFRNDGLRKSSAFTLLELLVSMTLLVMVIVILMSMVDGSTKLWKHSENTVDGYREARGAINTISADLASIVPATNTNLFQLNTFALKPPIEAAPTNSHLFFLTSQRSDAQEHEEGDTSKNVSDVCTVGYYLAYAKASINSPQSTLNLYRYFRSSDSTFDDAIKNGQSANLIVTQPSPQSSSGDEMLARNVTSFQVRAYTATSAETLPDKTTQTANLINFKQDEKTPMPNVIEVDLTVVNNDTAQRFNSLADWKNKNSSSYKQNAKTFTTRIRLPTDSAIASPTPTPTPSPTPAPTP